MYENNRLKACDEQQLARQVRTSCWTGPSVLTLQAHMTNAILLSLSKGIAYGCLHMWKTKIGSTTPL